MNAATISDIDMSLRCAAVALAMLVAWRGPHGISQRRPRPRSLVIGLWAMLALVLSYGYLLFYLEGGPRIIDATAYFLEGRAFSEGHWAWPLSDPEASVLGRFMVRTAANDAAAVIFPPGYPALLAVGFRLGLPLFVGPMLAAALVLATAHLMRSVVLLVPSWQRIERPLVHGAAGLSACCGVMRYHTADTMSHGLATLCFTFALSCALRQCTSPRVGWHALGFGLSMGWLFATRPVTAMGLGLTLCLYEGLRMLRRAAPVDRRAWLLAAIGLLPGVYLWARYQWTVTGSMWTTAQAVYYAVSDGPAGCFRYGFGTGVGCLGEHTRFVSESVGEHYGLLETIGTTGRRLKTHLGDPLNMAALYPVALYGVFVAWHKPALRVFAYAIVIGMFVYAPFYFDGNIPGGGARMFSELLPLEHILAVLAAVSLSARASLFGRSRPSRWSASQASSTLVAVAIIGFAVDGAAQHEQLRLHDGGRPMFETADVVAPASPKSLLFLETDHGFNVAYAPHLRRVGRFRGDDFDRLLWESHGRPASYRYVLDWSDRVITGVRLLPVLFDPRPTAELPLLLEGESLWPAERQRGAWTWPVWLNGTDCASRGRGLRFLNDYQHKSGEVLLALPSQTVAGRQIVPWLAGVRTGLPAPSQPGAPLRLVLRNDDSTVHRWSVAPLPPGSCRALKAVQLPKNVGHVTLRIEGTGPIALDRLELSRKR